MNERRVPRRVLMTADTIGGVWTYVIELIRALDAYDVEVGLATMGMPLSRMQWNEIMRLPNVEVFESTYKLEWMRDPWDDVHQAGTWLMNIQDRFEPEIVHLNGYVHGTLDWKAPKLMVGHSCVLSWWHAVKGEPAPACWNRYRDAVTRGISSAQIVAAPSRSMLAALESQYGISSRKRVIFNGRSPDEFQPSMKEPYIFAAGRVWDAAKNIHSLEKIAGDISWPVFVAGEDECGDGATLPGGKVCRLGKISTRRLANWYARASIYAHPAYYEPFGLTVLEAALSGCALVLGDIPSLRELWDGCAVFIPPGDAAGLRRALMDLIRDEPARKVLACRSRHLARSFTPKKMAQAYVRTYSELLRSRTGQGTG